MKCDVCGKDILWSEYSNCNICSSECHTKYFWKKFIETINEHKILIDGSNAFIYEPHDINKESFGDIQFELKFNDNHVEMSNGIWFVGSIPAEFKEQLPDNIKMSNVKAIETIEHYNRVIGKMFTARVKIKRKQK